VRFRQAPDDCFWPFSVEKLVSKAAIIVAMLSMRASRSGIAGFFLQINNQNSSHQLSAKICAIRHHDYSDEPRS